MQMMLNLLHFIQNVANIFINAFVTVLGTACGTGLVAVIVKCVKNNKH